MSAISQRSKRATAGKRMANLVGKAVEDDEAFWNHDTWGDDDGDDDGNDSFHESDEDSEVRKDHFDSDFDDSESDNEAEDVAAGEAEEKRLRQEEKASRRTALDGVARAGRELLQKKRGRIKGNRIFGDGFNAGLVLNFPPNFERGRIAADVPRVATTTTHEETVEEEVVKAVPNALEVTVAVDVPVEVPPKSLPQQVPAPVQVKDTEPTTAVPLRSASVRTTPVRGVAAVPVTQGGTKAAASKVTLASTRARRGKKHLRTSTQESAKTSATSIGKGGKATRSTAASATAATSVTKRSKRRHFSQEELLLEAATITEPENGRWLLGRKRLYQQAEAARNAQNHQQGSSKLLQRYVSKRGSFNTLNFSEMDAVPKILVPNTSESAKPKPVQPTLCVISGKRARYKDPKTQLGYYDLAAYRELRRRHDAGETLVAKSAPVAAVSAAQPPTKKTKTQSSPKLLTKPAEVPSLQPEATESHKVPSVAASPATHPADTPVVASPAASTPTATAAAGTRAQRTVQDPDRKLTMTTRNASKHASPDKPKPIGVATKSKLIPPIPAFSGAPGSTTTTKATPKAAKASSSKRSAASAPVAAAAATTAKKQRVASPKAVASASAAVTAVLPASTANAAAVAVAPSKSSAVAPKSTEPTVPIVTESKTKHVAKLSDDQHVAKTQVTALGSIAKTVANEAAAAVGKPIVGPSPTTKNESTVTSATKPIAAAPAKKKASKAPAKRKRAATTTKAPSTGAASRKTDPGATKLPTVSTTKTKTPDAAHAKAIGGTSKTATPSREGATSKPAKRHSTMSPNTLVHTALAAYLKQQEEDQPK